MYRAFAGTDHKQFITMQKDGEFTIGIILWGNERNQENYNDKEIFFKRVEYLENAGYTRLKH